MKINGKHVYLGNPDRQLEQALNARPDVNRAEIEALPRPSKRLGGLVYAGAKSPTRWLRSRGDAAPDASVPIPGRRADSPVRDRPATAGATAAANPAVRQTETARQSTAAPAGAVAAAAAATARPAAGDPAHAPGASPSPHPQQAAAAPPPTFLGLPPEIQREAFLNLSNPDLANLSLTNTGLAQATHRTRHLREVAFTAQERQTATQVAAVATIRQGPPGQRLAAFDQHLADAAALPAPGRAAVYRALAQQFRAAVNPEPWFERATQHLFQAVGGDGGLDDAERLQLQRLAVGWQPHRR